MSRVRRPCAIARNGRNLSRDLAPRGRQGTEKDVRSSFRRNYLSWHNYFVFFCLWVLPLVDYDADTDAYDVNSFSRPRKTKSIGTVSGGLPRIKPGSLLSSRGCQLRHMYWVWTRHLFSPARPIQKWLMILIVWDLPCCTSCIILPVGCSQEVSIFASVITRILLPSHD
jgi:hypothetical protein